MPLWAVALGRVHLTRNRTNGGRVGTKVIVHSAQLEPDEITVVNGIRVTTPPRTVIDLARTEPFEQAVAIGDSALHQGLTTAAELREHLHRAKRRPGCKAAAKVVDFLDGRSESVGESRSRVAFYRGGLPAPELQASVFTDDGELVARVDFLFEELGVICEFDGMVKYQNELRGRRTPEEVVIAEKIREDRLRALGWIVVRFTWEDLDNPERLIARIQSAARAAQRAQRVGSWIPTPRI